MHMVREWAELATYLSMFSIIIPVLVVAIRWKTMNDLQRLIRNLVIVTFFSEAIIYALTFFTVNNLPVVHLFTVLQFAILVWVLRKGLKPSFSKKRSWALIFLFSCFAIVDAVFLNGIFNFNSYSRPLASFILLILVLSFFHKTLKELKIKSLHQEPIFWINIGVLIYFSGSLFIFLFTNYIKASNEALFTLWGIHAIFNILLNISYSIALWIRPTN